MGQADLISFIGVSTHRMNETLPDGTAMHVPQVVHADPQWDGVSALSWMCSCRQIDEVGGANDRGRDLRRQGLGSLWLEPLVAARSASLSRLLTLSDHRFHLSIAVNERTE